MLIPTQTTIRTEDFTDQKEWIGRLLTPINRFLLSVTSAINGNVTLGDNIPCQTQSVSFTSNGTSDFPKTFKWNLSVAPTELRVCSALENGSAITVGFAWSYANGQITLSTIFKISSSGNAPLVQGSSYNIVMRGQP